MTDLVERPDAPVLNRPDTDSWAQVVAAVGRLAGMIAYTEFVPASYRGNEAAVAAAILYGREVGLPPMTSLREIYVLDGRPALYAEAMRGLVLAEGHEFEYREATGATCTARARRRGSTKWAEVTWTLDDARRAELIRPRSNWQKYPRAMLKARATAELCRDLFSDVLHGSGPSRRSPTRPHSATPSPRSRARRPTRRRPSNVDPERPRRRRPWKAPGRPRPPRRPQPPPRVLNVRLRPRLSPERMVTKTWPRRRRPSPRPTSHRPGSRRRKSRPRSPNPLSRDPLPRPRPPPTSRSSTTPTRSPRAAARSSN